MVLRRSFFFRQSCFRALSLVFVLERWMGWVGEGEVYRSLYRLTTTTLLPSLCSPFYYFFFLLLETEALFCLGEMGGWCCGMGMGGMGGWGLIEWARGLRGSCMGGWEGLRG